MKAEPIYHYQKMGGGDADGGGDGSLEVLR